MINQNDFFVNDVSSQHELNDHILKDVNRSLRTNLNFSHIWFDDYPDEESGFRLKNYQMIKDKHVILFACPVDDELENDTRQTITACKQQYLARSVIVVMPYLRYCRQDHEELSFEITRLRWSVRELKLAGADDLLACDLHSEENTAKFCRKSGLNLHISDPTEAFARAFKEEVKNWNEVKVIAPDFGAIERALKLARLLGTKVIAYSKERIDTQVSAGKTTQEFEDRIRKCFGGEAPPVSCDLDRIEDTDVIIVDDIFATGDTVILMANALRKKGARRVYLIITHPVCTPGWKRRLFPYNKKEPFNKIFFGNTRPRGTGRIPYRESTGQINKVDMAPVIAKTLAEILQTKI